MNMQTITQNRVSSEQNKITKTSTLATMICAMVATITVPVSATALATLILRWQFTKQSANNCLYNKLYSTFETPEPRCKCPGFYYFCLCTAVHVTLFFSSSFAVYCFLFLFISIPAWGCRGMEGKRKKTDNILRAFPSQNNQSQFALFAFIWPRNKQIQRCSL